MFDVGLLELAVIALVAVIVLGPDRLPDLARQAARAYALETDLSEEEALERIRAGWEAEGLDPGGLN